MSPTRDETCPDCGARLPEGGPGAPCPACLLAGAVDGAPGDDGPFAPPCTFGGYELRSVLGKGGMGTVYEAEDSRTGRRVALKMLDSGLDTPELRKRFLREGRLAASVNHPNSLYVFGSEEIDTVPVITMEVAGGGTLGDRLAARGPFGVAEAVDAILDVIAGLESAAAGGVLHRDVKPTNCFVDPDGTVKVGDYGLSVSTLTRDDSLVTASGAIMGTPAFASPEQLRGDPLDVRADVYSVGATLHALLTGKPPIGGDNVVQVVANAMHQAPSPLRESRADVPAGLERVVLRCLAKAADDRYADHASLRDALLPFSSRVPEPASMKQRAAAGWVDYLAAFLVPYVVLMITVG
ncbi:MAG: serine/threonine-protein kinase, partial [Planctomycetota bacterium]